MRKAGQLAGGLPYTASVVLMGPGPAMAPGYPTRPQRLMVGYEFAVVTNIWYHICGRLEASIDFCRRYATVSNKVSLMRVADSLLQL